MAKKRKASALVVYNLLLREVSTANGKLKKEKQLSLPKRRKFIKEKLWEKYAERSRSSIKVGELRTEVTKKIKLAVAKKRKKPEKKFSIYALLLHEVTQANKLLGEDKKLSLAERRAFVKQKLLPEFGKLKKSQVRLWEIREAIHKKFKKLPKKEGCDVTLLDIRHYTEIDYYELDDRLRLVMPNCIFVKVRAGEFGTTKIFNTRDYNYERSGVGGITRSINDWVDKLPVRRRKSAYIVYNGIVRLRPKKPNDGTPENYYLELTLFINDKSVVAVDKPVELPKKSRKKKHSKSEMTRTKMRSYVNARLKKMRTAKSVFKKMRVKIAKTAHSVKTTFDQNKKIFSDEDRKRITDKAISELTKMIKRNFDNGKINQKNYDNFKKVIDAAFARSADKKAKRKNNKNK